MPTIAAVHPQAVHFAIALVVAGVGFRLASLFLADRAAWLTPAASTLLALGAVSSLVAVRSGNDAHGPVERTPGVRAAVMAHEEWGERARNAALLLCLLEAVATALQARSHARAREAAVVAAVAGVITVGVFVRAGDLGGDLVYSYAGGVGIRSGDPTDVHRTLVTAAYQQAALDRRDGRPADAAALLEIVANRFPEHLELQLARVDSRIVDRNDPEGALARLDTLQIPTTDTRLRIRAGLLRAAALAAGGELSAARQVLETLRTEFPANAEIQQRIAGLPAAR